MNELQFPGVATRAVMGPGAVTLLGDELTRLGCARALVLGSSRSRSRVAAITSALGARLAGTFFEAAAHVPADTAAAARARASEAEADVCVAIGGGSAIGAAKAIALTTGLPIVAIPTTYAGSEMTSIYGITDAGGKRTGRDPRVLPRLVLYDPELLRDVPVALLRASALNALAHAAEAMYAPDRTPILEAQARRALALLARSLLPLAEPAAQRDAQLGAHLAGGCLGVVAMGLHHKLCHLLGGSFGLPHAETHAVVLPYVLAYNQPAAPAALAALAEALGVADAATGLHQLGRAAGMPAGLAALGLPEAALARVLELLLGPARGTYANPRPLEAPALRALLDAAFHGAAPAA